MFPEHDDPLTYEDLQALAADLGRPLKTLFAQADSTDPWMAGVPARKAKAEWLAALWRQYGAAPGTHIRRFHYLLVSQPDVRMPEGERYLNTDECYKFLTAASIAARHLDLIDARDVADQRNEPAKINYDAEEKEAAVDVDGDLDRYAAPEFELPTLTVTAPKIPQPYVVSIWIEKSTMNDVIDPLAARYGVNVLPGTGETSITRCIELADRADAVGRPVRVLYVTDFDPAGRSMPLAAARKIEFELRKNMPHLDVQVRDIALTLEQCRRYRLPRTPIKKGESRGAKFEARFGEGATELDALEALHPGELARILEREILRYYDTDLATEVESVRSEAQTELGRITTEVHDQHVDQIQELRDEHERVLAAVNAYRVKARPIFELIRTDLESAAPSFDWPDGSFAAAEDEDPLFDSTRDYIEQIDRYKEHKNEPTERWSETRVCAHCKAKFTALKSHARFCSKKCGNDWHYQQQPLKRQRKAARP